jgi:hypothetical protein
MSSITIYDEFHAGDELRLEYPDGGRFVARARMQVEKRAAAATFSEVEPRDDYRVTVIRAPREPVPVTIEIRRLDEDLSQVVGWQDGKAVGDVIRTWTEWEDVGGDGTVTIDGEDVTFQVRVKPDGGNRD